MMESDNGGFTKTMKLALDPDSINLIPCPYIHVITAAPFTRYPMFVYGSLPQLSAIPSCQLSVTPCCQPSSLHCYCCFQLICHFSGLCLDHPLSSFNLLYC